MRLFESLDKTDRTLVSLSGSLAALLLFLLLFDIFSATGPAGDAAPIGQISEIRNKVKRKFNQSLLWYETKQNETVYENDWIFTGTDSIVKIKLETGDEIAIEPDSLIVLSKKNGILELNLQHGRMLANLKTDKVKIQFVNGDRQETLPVGQGLVRIGKKESVPGEAINKEVVATPIPEMQSLDEVIKKETFVIPEGFLPPDGLGLLFRKTIIQKTSLYPGQKTSLRIDWLDPENRWTAYDFRLSDNPEFNKPLNSQRLQKAEALTVLGQNGPFYYQVRGVDRKGAPSPWSRTHQAQLTITWKEPLPGVQLSQDRVIYKLKRKDLSKVTPGRFFEASQEQPARLQWQGFDEAKNYRVLISDKEDFSNILEEKITADTELNLTSLKLGRSFVKVVAEDEAGIPLSQESRGQVITRIPAPARSTLKTKRISGDEIQLEWDPQIPAPAFEVSYTTGPESPVVKKRVEGHRLKIKSDSPQLKWKVRAIEPETKEELSAYSEEVDWYDQAKKLASIASEGEGQTQSVVVPRIISPAARKTFIAIKKEPLFMVLRWDYPEEAEGYFVEISKSPDMSKPLLQKYIDSGKTQMVVNQSFLPGIYYLRVRAKKGDVTQEAWSEVEAFRVVAR